jgi:hypothetical protein
MSKTKPFQKAESPSPQSGALAGETREARSLVVRSLEDGDPAVGWIMGAGSAERFTSGSERAWG